MWLRWAAAPSATDTQQHQAASSAREAASLDDLMIITAPDSAVPNMIERQKNII
jgi:hypothetical protein